MGDKKYMSKSSYWFHKTMFTLFNVLYFFAFSGEEYLELSRMFDGGYKKIDITPESEDNDE